MIVVDTSVWIACLRGRDKPARDALDALLDADAVALCAPVRVEILGGASRDDHPTLRRALSALPLLAPTEATWKLMESWVAQAVSSGERFGVGDLLIGALAAEQGYPVWSLASDFARMQRLGFLRLHRPPRP